MEPALQHFGSCDAKQTLQSLLDPAFDFETRKRQYLVMDAQGVHRPGIPAALD
mgnify:CR=1 FL=1